MKGIILAGGAGTRLLPLTKVVSKQLLAIYDKPMIYYPLSVLMEAGIKDILIITTEECENQFKWLLGDGSIFGINISYTIQPAPEGLAQAFILGEKFLSHEPGVMILGDNIFYGQNVPGLIQKAMWDADHDEATIFGYKVRDPERFGVAEFDDNNQVISIEEKPKNPKSNYAITGLYCYPKDVSEKAKTLQPSDRNELEITDLNNLYLQEKRLNFIPLNDHSTWFDTGTFESLYDAASFIRTMQEHQNIIIGCPEAVAFQNKWIDIEQFTKLCYDKGKNSYREYLLTMLGE